MADPTSYPNYDVYLYPNQPNPYDVVLRDLNNSLVGVSSTRAVKNGLFVEILDQNSIWQDITGDCKNIKITRQGLLQDAGTNSPRGNSIAGVGRLELIVNNQSKSYTPGHGALIDSRTRVRIRADGSTLGYCLRAYISDHNQDGAYFSQQLNATTAVNDVWTLTYQARAQFDYQYNIDGVYMVTDNEIQTPQYKTYTNKWATYTVTFTATKVGTEIEVRFRANSAVASNKAIIEYKNISLSNNGGANIYASDNWTIGAVTGWTAKNLSSVSNGVIDSAVYGLIDQTARIGPVSGTSTLSLSVGPDTWIQINGSVDQAEPSPFKRAGNYEIKLTCLDFVVLYQDSHSNLVAQSNIRSDQVITLLANQMAQGKVVVGTQYDTGLNTFPFVFDTYTYKQTSIYDAFRDTSISEMGRFCLDNDGTLRFYNQRLFSLAVKGTIALTLSEGQNFNMHGWLQTKTITNDVIITVVPRQVATTQSVLFLLDVVFPSYPAAYLPIPVGTTKFTFPYSDAQGNSIGGTGVADPRAGIDYFAYRSLGLFDFGAGAINTGTVDPFNSVDGTYDTFLQVTDFASGASSADVTFTNTSTHPYYLWFFTINGYAVTANNPVDQEVFDQASIDQNQKIVFTKTLPFSADANFALSMAQLYVAKYKNAFTEIDYVEFENISSINGVDLLSLNQFDVIAINDDQLNLTNSLHAIVMRDVELDPKIYGYVKKIKFYLERIDQITYGIIDDPVYGLIDLTAVLYI